MNTLINKMQYDIDKTAQNVVQLLYGHNIILNTAESCTGGLLSGAVTSASGSSEVFKVGICAYDNEIKKRVLGVSAETLEKHGAVSAECAAEMALGAGKVSGGLFETKQKISVSVTGIAGPYGGSPEKPVGTVFFACSHKGGLDVLELLINADGISAEQKRQYIRLESVRQALILVSDTITTQFD
ncbi:MAG: CinA family protein [Oscillospiraceae bacterium]|nr:CinA family protein [Oscillospiraceae bacterium]